MSTVFPVTCNSSTATEADAEAVSREEGLAACVHRVRMDVQTLEQLANNATAHQRECNELLVALQPVLPVCDQLLSIRRCTNSGGGELPHQLVSAAVRLLQAVRDAIDVVRERGQPAGLRRLVSWWGWSAGRRELVQSRRSITAALDYCTACVLAAAPEGAACHVTTPKSPGVVQQQNGIAQRSASQIACATFGAGALRSGRALRGGKEAVVAVRFVGAHTAGRPTAAGRSALLVQTRSGVLEIHDPKSSCSYSTVLPGGTAGRLRAVAVDHVHGGAVWACYDDGSVQHVSVAAVQEQASKPPTQAHAAISCACAAAGVLWLGDAAGRVLSVSHAPDPLVRLVTAGPGVGTAAPVAAIWASACGGTAAAANAQGTLRLISALECKVQDEYHCKDRFGAVLALEGLPWPAAPAPASSVRTAGGGAAAQGGNGWRLLTGHSQGCMVLWQTDGGRLSPASILGVPGPPVRAIHVVPHLSMLLSAHADGRLHVWPLPRPHMQLLELSHSATPRWHLPHGTVRAHRSSVTAMDSCGLLLATGSSAGGVRLWDLLNLRARARQQGAVFEPLAAHLQHLQHLLAPAPQTMLSAPDGAVEVVRSRCPGLKQNASGAALPPVHSVPAADGLVAVSVKGEELAGSRPPHLGAANGSTGAPATSQLQPSVSAVEASFPARQFGVAALCEAPMPHTASPTVRQTRGGAQQGPLHHRGVQPTSPARPNRASFDLQVLQPQLLQNPEPHSGSAGGATTHSVHMTGSWGASGHAAMSVGDLSLPPGTSIGPPTLLQLSLGSGAPVWAIVSALGPPGVLNTTQSVPQPGKAGEEGWVAGMGRHGGSAGGIAAGVQLGMALSDGRGPVLLQRGSGVPLVASCSTGGSETPSSAATAAVAAAAASSALLALRNQCIIDADLRLVEEIGAGAEGRVWRGKWHHTSVAVKEMRPQSASFARIASVAWELRRDAGGATAGGRQQDGAPAAQLTPETQAVLKEVACLMDLSQHPNIVRFIGLCLDPPRIVTEFYPKGSLFSIIERARDQADLVARRQLQWGGRLVLLHDVAAGMSFLHGRGYVHGDLRSPNVFVASDGHAKVGDFGLAQILGGIPEGHGGECPPFARTEEADGAMSNPRWLAPEVVLTQRTSQAGDVYSFGVLMFELLTWEVPFSAYGGLQVVVQHSMCEQYGGEPFRPHLPPDDQLPQVDRGTDSLGPYKQLMAECWAQQPHDRPSFSKVAERLQKIMHWEQASAHVRATMPAVLTPQAHAASQGDAFASALLRAAAPSADVAAILDAAAQGATAAPDSAAAPSSARGLPPSDPGLLGPRHVASSDPGFALWGSSAAVGASTAPAAPPATALNALGSIHERQRPCRSFTGGSTPTQRSPAAPCGEQEQLRHQHQHQGRDTDDSARCAKSQPQSPGATAASGYGRVVVLDSNRGRDDKGTLRGSKPASPDMQASLSAAAQSSCPAAGESTAHASVHCSARRSGTSPQLPTAAAGPAHMVDLFIADASGFQHICSSLTPTRTTRSSGGGAGGYAAGGGRVSLLSADGRCSSSVSSTGGQALHRACSQASCDGAPPAHITSQYNNAFSAGMARRTAFAVHSNAAFGSRHSCYSRSGGGAGEGEAAAPPSIDAVDAAREALHRVYGGRRTIALQADGLQVLLVQQDDELEQVEEEGSGEAERAMPTAGSTLPQQLSEEPRQGQVPLPGMAAGDGAAFTISPAASRRRLGREDSRQRSAGSGGPGAMPAPVAGPSPRALQRMATSACVRAGAGAAPRGADPWLPAPRRRTGSAGSGVAAVALASIHGSLFGGSVSSVASSRGKGAWSIKAMSLFVNALSSYPEDARNAFLTTTAQLSTPHHSALTSPRGEQGAAAAAGTSSHPQRSRGTSSSQGSGARGSSSRPPSPPTGPDGAGTAGALRLARSKTAPQQQLPARPSGVKAGGCGALAPVATDGAQPSVLDVVRGLRDTHSSSSSSPDTSDGGAGSCAAQTNAVMGCLGVPCRSRRGPEQDRGQRHGDRDSPRDLETEADVPVHGVATGASMEHGDCGGAAAVGCVGATAVGALGVGRVVEVAEGFQVVLDTPFAGLDLDSLL